MRSILNYTCLGEFNNAKASKHWKWWH